MIQLCNSGMANIFFNSCFVKYRIFACTCISERISSSNFRNVFFTAELYIEFLFITFPQHEGEDAFAADNTCR